MVLVDLLWAMLTLDQVAWLCAGLALDLVDLLWAELAFYRLAFCWVGLVGYGWSELFAGLVFCQAGWPGWHCNLVAVSQLVYAPSLGSFSLP